MSYTVVWMPKAENRLAELWTAGPDRAAVRTAADEIDARLRMSPLTEGESRTDAVRIMILPPLVVTFEVHDPDQLVRVLNVWRARRLGR